MKLLVLVILIIFPTIIWSQESTEKDSVYLDVEASFYKDEPGFPGGVRALHKYLRNELTFNERPGFDPETVSRIYVTFTISELGKIENVEVHDTKNEQAIWEIERIFYRMPEWTPSYQSGQPTETHARIPLRLNWIEPIPFAIF